MNNIFLIEDHDEALKVWREKKIKNLDLVHVDAHIDFGFYPARPIEKIVSQAKSLKDLKRNLENTIAFMNYEKNLDKQANIGNYIYPAMEEGIVKDFYWVVPGGLKEFKESGKFIKGMLKNFAKQDSYQTENREQRTEDRKDGIISTKLFGRKFVICILEKLPILKQKVLLDIDTDFLVIDSFLNANNTGRIGKRKRWIRPDRLVKELIITKSLKPAFITIAYSVNGGYTPMKYKILGDELAYRLSSKHFKGRYGQKFIASVFFERFESTGKKKYYQKAIKLNLSYRAADNNYGPLYLSIRKFSKAKKEFSKIARVDPKNPSCLLGLGSVALERKDFRKAKEYFSQSLNNELNGINEPNELNDGLFVKTRIQALFGLARAEFGLKNFKRARQLLIRYRNFEPLEPQSYYFLGSIFEKEKDFHQAANFYKDAIRLGFGSIEPISRLLRISCYFKEKDVIIKYVTIKYREFKKEFLRRKRLSLKQRRKIKDSRRVEKKMLALERKLDNERG